MSYHTVSPQDGYDYGHQYSPYTGSYSSENFSHGSSQDSQASFQCPGYLEYTPRTPASPNPSRSPYDYTTHSEVSSPAGTLDGDYVADGQFHALQKSKLTPERSRHGSSGSSKGEPSSSAGHESGGLVCCLYPGCSTKPFKRNADLDRHYKHKHVPDGEKETYVCDYKNCSRKQDSPFHRKDHFRDHLREYHNEDLGKRGKPVSANWVENRNVKSEWWRCTRCLHRVSIKKHSFECPSCKTSCDQTRAQSRKGR